METIYYKGFKIKTTPYQLTKSKRWALEFQIFSPSGKSILAKMFSAVNTYESKREADLHCLNLAKQIIDSRPEI
jgi:hypothetical protein